MTQPELKAEEFYPHVSTCRDHRVSAGAQSVSALVIHDFIWTSQPL